MNEDATQDGHPGRQSSERKIAANRRNAAKSKGPTTKAGKKKSALNAVKHGMAGKTLIIPGLEKPKRFRSLHRRIRKGLQPVGVLEELDVEAIATAYWRLNRCLRSEGTAFATATAHHMLGRPDDDEDDDMERAELDDDAGRHFTLPNSDALKRHSRYECARRSDLEHAIAVFEARKKGRRKQAHRAANADKERAPES